MRLSIFPAISISFETRNQGEMSVKGKLSSTRIHTKDLHRKDIVLYAIVDACGRFIDND